jgi:hypothetical protein
LVADLGLASTGATAVEDRDVVLSCRDGRGGGGGRRRMEDIRQKREKTTT